MWEAGVGGAACDERTVRQGREPMCGEGEWRVQAMGPCLGLLALEVLAGLSRRVAGPLMQAKKAGEPEVVWKKAQ